MKCLTPTWNNNNNDNHNHNDNKYYDNDSDMLRFNVKAQFVSSKHLLFV